MVEVDMEEIQEAISESWGWCTRCNEFTYEMVEPDAEGYECPACGNNTVYGAEQAVIMGLL